MVKNLQFRKLDDDIYFKFLELKAKLKAKKWNDLAKKIIEKLESGSYVNK